MTFGMIVFAVAVVLALGGAAAYVWWRQHQAGGVDVTASHLDSLQAQISQLQRELSRTLSRLEKLEQRASAPARPTPSAEPVAGNGSYNQARQLVRMGLSAVEVAERCGISRSEAELIVSLYRNNSPS